jgi:hypothetical protein
MSLDAPPASPKWGIGRSQFLTPRNGNRFVRSVPEAVPVDLNHPALLGLVIMNDAFGPHLIGLPVIVRVVGVEGHNQSMGEPDPLTLQILNRTDAIQAQAIFIVQVLKVGIKAGNSHDFTPFDEAVGWGWAWLAGIADRPGLESIR